MEQVLIRIQKQIDKTKFIALVGQKRDAFGNTVSPEYELYIYHVG